MADNAVEIKFLGNLEGIRVSVTQISELLRGLVSPIQGVKAQLGELAEAFAAAFAVEKVQEFARRMGELGEQVERSAAMLGVSTDAVQELGYIAKSSGIGLGELEHSFGLLARNIIAQSDTTKRALAALGLSFRDLAGKDASQTLDILAPKLSEIKDGATKAAIELALLGRAGLQMGTYFNQGAEGIARLKEEAAAIKAIIPPEAIAQLAQMHHQFVMMDAAIQGATVAGFMPFRSAISGVITIVTHLAAEFTAAMKSGGMMKDTVDFIAAAFKGLVTVLAAVIYVFKDLWAVGVFAVDTIGDGFMTLGKVIASIVSQIAATWSNFWTGLVAAGSAAIDNLKAQFSGLAAIASAAATLDLEGVKAAYAKMESASADAGKRMAAGLKQAGSGVDWTVADHEFSEHATRQRDRSFELGQSLINNDRAFAKEYNTIWDTAHKHEEDSKKRAANFGSPTNTDAVSAAMKAIEGQIKAEQEGLKERVAIYDLAAKTHQISESERVQNVRTATAQEYEAELSLLHQELGISGLKLAQRQEIENKITALEGRHRLEEIEFDKQAVAERQKTWEGYFSTLQGAFNGQLRGLLAGTTTFGQAFKSIIGDLVIAFIQGVEKMVFEWIAGQIGMTAAGVTGAQTRAAAETTGQAASAATMLANAMRSIMSSVGITIAGVTANQAPLVGPLAVAEGAAAGATVEAAAVGALMAETGIMTVPNVGLAMLHPNEMVVPGPAADVMRDAIGGGGGGGAVHFNISAVDASGVASFFRQHGDKIAATLQSVYQKNRSLRPAF